MEVLVNGFRSDFFFFVEKYLILRMKKVPGLFSDFGPSFTDLKKRIDLVQKNTFLHDDELQNKKPMSSVEDLRQKVKQARQRINDNGLQKASFSGIRLDQMKMFEDGENEDEEGLKNENLFLKNMLNIGHAQDEYGTDHDDHDDNQDEQDDQAFFALQKEASNLPYDSPGGVSVPEYLEELTSPPKKKFSFIKKSAKNVIPPPPRYDHVRPKVRKDGSQSDRKDRQNLANKPQRAQRGRSVSPILAANKRLAKTRHKSPIINHRPKTSSSSSLPEVTNPEIIGRSSNTRRRPRTTSLAQDFLLNVDILDNSFPLEGAVEYESGWTSPSGISAQASDLTTQLRHPRGALWNETDQVDSTQWVSNSDDVSQCCENKDFEQRSGVSSLEKESYGEDFLDIKKEKVRISILCIKYCNISECLKIADRRING
eukprot:GHVP01013957.1.p1 GENE.GHVP01013957.1~~GHVP01013957.1.p1  ORF type:complete len:427 (+),score=84.97 GHVP01013957.1:77-1357(+)